MRAAVLCALAVAVLPPAPCLRAPRSGAPARRQAATCSAALGEEARAQSCDEALDLVLQLQRSLGTGERGGNGTASNEASSKDECEEIKEQLEELEEVQKSCDADPGCWRRLGSPLSLVKSALERRKARLGC
mmetsp:Transcript_46080/g.144378  ORF Transcript_46080/g.144378 Transcript_46080/m.144378 type:complete len:132 (-) Transcript_46080:98-493(-)